MSLLLVNDRTSFAVSTASTEGVKLSAVCEAASLTLLSPTAEEISNT
jgi:hypothetical protein